MQRLTISTKFIGSSLKSATAQPTRYLLKSTFTGPPVTTVALYDGPSDDRLGIETFTGDGAKLPMLRTSSGVQTAPQKPDRAGKESFTFPA